MTITKYNWTRFIPYLELRFSIPFLSITAVQNLEDFASFRRYWIGYEIRLYKWSWIVKVYSFGKQMDIHGEGLTKNDGIRWKDCECVFFEKEKLRLYCPKHWEKEKK